MQERFISFPHEARKPSLVQGVPRALVRIVVARLGITVKTWRSSLCMVIQSFFRFSPELHAPGLEPHRSIAWPGHRPAAGRNKAPELPPTIILGWKRAPRNDGYAPRTKAHNLPLLLAYESDGRDCLHDILAASPMKSWPIVFVSMHSLPQALQFSNRVTRSHDVVRCLQPSNCSKRVRILRDT